MATYYNPAYRPALEEELSSTDVRHAALALRAPSPSERGPACEAFSPLGSTDTSAPHGRQVDILRVDSASLDRSPSPPKGRRASASSTQDNACKVDDCQHADYTKASTWWQRTELSAC